MDAIQPSSINEIVMSQDGSTTLYSHRFNDSYHSVNGAIDEANLVYIKNGFENAINTFKNDINVFELGFGTGLNALLTILTAKEKEIKIHYESIEAYPIEPTEIEKLNYSERIQHDFSDEVFKKIHQTEWNVETELINDIHFIKRNIRLEDMPMLKPIYHLVYYDAFGPSKQAEMWAEERIEKIANGIVKNGIFVTYSTCGELKRTLRNLNFQIEKLPGPKGKREVLKATKQ